MTFLKFCLLAVFFLSSFSSLFGLPHVEEGENRPPAATQRQESAMSRSIGIADRREESLLSLEANAQSNILSEEEEGTSLLETIDDSSISSDVEGVGEAYQPWIERKSEEGENSLILGDNSEISPKGMEFYNQAKEYQKKSEEALNHQDCLLWEKAARQITLAGENQFNHDRYDKNKSDFIPSPLVHKSFYPKITKLHKKAALTLVDVLTTIPSKHSAKVIESLKQASANFKNAALCKTYAGTLSVEKYHYLLGNDSAKLYEKAALCSYEAAIMYQENPSKAVFLEQKAKFIKGLIESLNEMDNLKEQHELMERFCVKKGECCEELIGIYDELASEKIKLNDDLFKKITSLESNVVSWSRAINMNKASQVAPISLQKKEETYEEPCLLKEAAALSAENDFDW